MPLIPSEPKKQRTQLHLRLDAGVIADLDLYAGFIHSSKEYVIESMLAFVLRKDRDFQDWLSTNRPDPAAATLIVDANSNGATSAATATTAARRRASTSEAA